MLLLLEFSQTTKSNKNKEINFIYSDRQLKEFIKHTELYWDWYEDIVDYVSNIFGDGWLLNFS